MHKTDQNLTMNYPMAWCGLPLLIQKRSVFYPKTAGSGLGECHQMTNCSRRSRYIRDTEVMCLKMYSKRELLGFSRHFPAHKVYKRNLNNVRVYHT
jgi:hypothetical protein